LIFPSKSKKNSKLISSLQKRNLEFRYKKTKQESSNSWSGSSEIWKKKPKGGIGHSFPNSIDKSKVEISPPEQDELKIELPIIESQLDISCKGDEKKESYNLVHQMKAKRNQKEKLIFHLQVKWISQKWMFYHQTRVNQRMILHF
jgi:hypothetical protein